MFGKNLFHKKKNSGYATLVQMAECIDHECTEPSKKVKGRAYHDAPPENPVPGVYYPPKVINYYTCDKFDTCEKKCKTEDALEEQ